MFASSRLVLLTILSTVSPILASQEPDLNYWKAPFVLRIASDDNALDGAFLSRDNPSGRAFSVYLNVSSTKSYNYSNAYPVYPSGEPFAATADYSTRTQLFEQQYHSLTNSTELVLIWGSKPATADGTPLVELGIDEGPGINHIWPPASTYVRWGSYQFVFDEDGSHGKVWLKERGYDDEGWNWVVWPNYQDIWVVGRWNGTTPDQDQGWGPTFFSILESLKKVDIEVVPLWTLTDNVL